MLDQKINDMKNRKKECSSCIHRDEYRDERGCVCAEECVDYDQWLLDEEITEKEQEEALKIIEEIYKESNGPDWGVVIGEDLYNRMERLIKAYA